MKMVLRLVLGVLGLFYLFVGFGFLTDPVGMGADFGVTAEGAQGLSTIRSDFAAFFWVSGGALLLGAWRQNGGAFFVTAALMGIVFLARALSLVLDGTYEGWHMPMVAEAVTVVLALAGAKVLGGHSATGD